MNVDLAIVGAGPAGLAAASVAAEAGLTVGVVEEGGAAGGRFFGPLTGHNATRKQTRPGVALLDRSSRAGAQLLTNTAVWNAARTESGFRLWLDGPDGIPELTSRALVVATGAFDRPHLFPGWTLPGVMTAGGLQQLVKRTGVVPGSRIVLAGTGPFLLPVAATLLEHGAKPVAVVEAASRSAWLRFGLASARLRSHLQEGFGYGSTLARGRVLPRFGWQVAGAEGVERVTRVILRRTDGGGDAERIDCDVLALGYGFLSQVEIPALLGLELRFDATQRQWLPLAGDDSATAVPGLFVCGDGARVRGYEAALHTGALAANLALEHLGRAADRGDLARSVRRAADFGRLVTGAFPAPDPLRWAAPETIVCRCEDVTLGEVEDAARSGADSVTALKAWCRAGQGPCQSRTCGTLLAAAVARARGTPLAEAGRASVRPPIRPVPVGRVAEAGGATPPDPIGTGG